MRESKTQSDIFRALAGQPRIRVWRNNTGAFRDQHGRLIRYGLVGSSDILGILAPEGRLLAIEAKTTHGRQSREQRYFEAMIVRFGGVYILARSVNDVIAVLQPWLTDTPKRAKQSNEDGH